MIPIYRPPDGIEAAVDQQKIQRLGHGAPIEDADRQRGKGQEQDDRHIADATAIAAAGEAIIGEQQQRAAKDIPDVARQLWVARERIGQP